MSNREENLTVKEEKISDLIPWYVNGTLDPEERTEVEQALNASPALREELADELRLATAISNRHDLDGAEERGWHRLEALIGEDEHAEIKERVEEETVSEVVSLNQFRAKRDEARNWRKEIFRAPVGLVAATVLIAGFAAFNASDWQAAPYQTLTNGGAVVVEGTETLRLKAATGVDSEHMQAYLSGLSLEIIDGPSPTGVYTVRLTNEKLDINEVFSTVQASDEVVFATKLGSGN